MKIYIILLPAVLMLAACSGGDDAPSLEPGDPERGAELFKKGKGTEVPPCSTCHRVSAGSASFALGPSLVDIPTTATTRVEGKAAEDYIRESILDPESFIVPGFQVSMYTGYADGLSEQEIADLIAYLLTL